MTNLYKLNPLTGKIEEEIWKDIKNYEGLYKISSFGRVKSLSRYQKNHSKLQKTEEKIKKDQKHLKGYRLMVLYNSGYKRSTTVHRLVAENFIPNPENKKCVNHINEVKTDNHYWNLNWMTPKENNEWGTRSKRQSITQFNGKTSKKVYQYDLKNNFVREWVSGSEAQRNGYDSSTISHCCNETVKGCKTHKGFKWSYKKLH